MRRARRRCFPRLVRAIKFEVSSTVMMSKEIGTSAHEARTAGKTVSSRFQRLMLQAIQPRRLSPSPDLCSVCVPLLLCRRGRPSDFGVELQ